MIESNTELPLDYNLNLYMLNVIVFQKFTDSSEFFFYFENFLSYFLLYLFYFIVPHPLFIPCMGTIEIIVALTFKTP